MRTEIDLNECEIYLNECEIDLNASVNTFSKPTWIDLNMNCPYKIGFC